MSSTNRSNARKEHVADYYVTPIQDIELFLKEFDKRFPNWRKNKYIKNMVFLKRIFVKIASKRWIILLRIMVEINEKRK